MVTQRAQQPAEPAAQGVEVEPERVGTEVPRAWRRLRPILVGAASAAVVLGTALFFLERLNHVYVTDARVGAGMISVSSRVSGWLTRYHVSSTDRVRVGDLMVSIDSRDASLRLAELDARLQGIRAERKTMLARTEMVDLQTSGNLEAHGFRLAAAQAALEAGVSALELSESELARTQSLYEQNIVSKQRWEEVRARQREAQQNHEKALADVSTANAALREADAGRRELRVLESELEMLMQQEREIEAQREQQALTLRDHDLRSSIDGVVDRTFAEEGEYVVPGQRLLMLHDPQDVWIDTNVRETQIRHLDLGDAAEVSVDAYPGEIFEGRIVRIGNAATSEFSLLPSTNPSGNFTKITQRIPVRIAVEQRGDMLRPGMMVEVDIDIRER